MDKKKETTIPEDMASSTSGCPVDHTVPPSGCPVDHGSMSAEKTAAVLARGCPVDHDGSPAIPERSRCDSGDMEAVKLPAVGDVFPDSTPQAGQRAALSSVPVSSNIPKGGTDKEETWVYPSPQRFYNSMKKKGWDPSERDMDVVVSIHNSVNEQCWRQVRQWEKACHPECELPLKLVRFRGKPDELSIKARLRSYFGYVLPFDRHDWTVERCGKEVTYIIDFYEGKPAPGSNKPPIFLDVRPGFTFGGMFDRAKMQLSSFFAISHGEGQ